RLSHGYCCKRQASTTVMPIERAVPAMIFAAWSMSCALRSVSLVLAISRTWSQVTLATLVLCGSPEPFSTPAAFSSSFAAGGVFSLKSNDRSSYTEISTGTTFPAYLPWTRELRTTGRPSDLGDLVERQLDRGLPAEDRHQDLQLLPVDVDLGDRRRQRRERTVHDRDRLADLEVDLDGRAAQRRRSGGFALAGLGRGFLLDLRGEELQ